MQSEIHTETLKAQSVTKHQDLHVCLDKGTEDKQVSRIVRTNSSIYCLLKFITLVDIIFVYGVDGM